MIIVDSLVRDVGRGWCLPLGAASALIVVAAAGQKGVDIIERVF
jgi:hypothetical protein